MDMSEFSGLPDTQVALMTGIQMCAALVLSCIPSEHGLLRQRSARFSYEFRDVSAKNRRQRLQAQWEALLIQDALSQDPAEERDLLAETIRPICNALHDENHQIQWCKSVF